MAHRGPDGMGFFSWIPGAPLRATSAADGLHPGRVGLTHRRLAIIDLSPSGAQPMIDQEAGLTIVYNGEIYNHVELRCVIQGPGQEIGPSDTAVLLALLRKEGLGALRRLNGMFAFALFDRKKQTVILARDPFGIKPLYISHTTGQLAFSSEIRPLLSCPWVTRDADPQALFDFLRHGETDIGAATLFSSIRALPPGHYMEVSIDQPDRAEAKRWWTLPVSSSPRTTVELAEAFRESVRQHMRADVEVAATLSGGIDSSAIVGAMHSWAPHQKLSVFSYIAADSAFDESRWIRAVADQTGAVVHEVTVRGDLLADRLDDLILSQEQPFSTSSIFAQSEVFRAVRNAGLKVVLDGQGADELFGGYEVFRSFRLVDLVRHGSMRKAMTMLRSLPPARRKPALLVALGNLTPMMFLASARWFARRSYVPEWVNAGWVNGHGIMAARSHSRLAGPSLLRQHVNDALTRTSLPMLLRYADRNAMAVSIENRVPFLTVELATLAAGLPDDALVASDGTCKPALREAVSPLIPFVVAQRREKIGFQTPEADWFRTSEALRSSIMKSSVRLPRFITSIMRDRLESVGAGRRTLEAEDWRVFMMMRWADVFGVCLPE